MCVIGTESYQGELGLPNLVLPVHRLRLQIHHSMGVAVDPVVPCTEPEESTAMTPAEIIYHRRIRVLDTAAKTDVAKACRVFGVSRTTFYRWKKVADAYGLAALMPKAKRPPAMRGRTPRQVLDTHRHKRAA
jgi:hypothetical protein